MHENPRQFLDYVTRRLRKGKKRGVAEEAAGQGEAFSYYSYPTHTARILGHGIIG
jgi:hypothetical protein